MAQLAGVYRDIKVGDPQPDDTDQTPIQAQVDGVQGVEPGAEGTEEYKIYEVYADLNLEGYENEDGIPLPYIVTIEEGSRKVLSIYRNYEEEDPTFQRQSSFVHYKLMKRVDDAQESSSKAVIKTWSRASTITPEFVGLTFAVHNGNKFIPVFVTENMVGHKLGEFSPTRNFRGHAGNKKDKKR